MNYIENFCYHMMWDKYDVVWNDMRSDVNILVGINGKGKTTLLDAIDSYYNEKFPKTFYAKYGGDRIEATRLDCPVIYIQSSDVPASVKKKGDSVLYNNLMQVVVQNEKRESFFNYRMRALNFPEERPRIEKRIDMLFKEINKYFAETGKKIDIDKDSNYLVFHDDDADRPITLAMLSAGEKQLLLILLTVFLMDEKPAVLLMDEPELSLHIEWQEKLIKTLRKFNKNCQLIITTHSPSIFASGWENCLTYMEDLYAE